MKPARIGLLAPALLVLCLFVRPEPNGPSIAPIPVNRSNAEPAPLRQVAHDVTALEMKQQTVAPPRRPEILLPPKSDANPDRRTQAPPKNSRPDEIMVGPDGVMYRRLPLGNSVNQR